MAVGKLFIGRKVREIRVAANATQVQFAERLGISTSYLNQIENNQRSVSAPVLLALADKFHINISELGSGESDRLMSALAEALTDPLFEAYSPTIQELKLIAHNAPGFAHALIDCHQAYRRNSEQLASVDEELARGLKDLTPYEEVRDFFHFHDNYVHALDTLAERLAKTVGSTRERLGALGQYLAQYHGINVAYASDDALLRQFDDRTRILTINTFAPLTTQVFQLAVHLAQIEAADAVEDEVRDGGFRSDEAKEICRAGLHNYFAGALLMPYGDFLQAAKELRHDIELLSLKFGVSVEQVCHRLSTLQRPGNKGIPIFFARIDRAGNITKRHSATKLQFARFGSACPLWNAHQAFEAGGQIIRQLAETPDGVRYLSVALQVTKGGSGFGRGETRFALAFGCEVSYADSFVYSDGINLGDKAAFEPIGISCRICERVGCQSRALPAIKRKLTIDHHRRGKLPYELN